MNNIINELKNLNFNKNKIKLYKDGNYENIKIKFSKNRINAKAKNDIIDFKEIVSDFFVTLSSNCKGFIKEKFFNNLEKTYFDIYTSRNDAKFIPDRVKNLDFSGLCTFSKKNISFYSKDSLNTYHELMHLASFKIINSVLCSGFEVTDNEIRFAYALNEGYTEFLTEKYFEHKVNNSYKFEVEIAKMLEIIVGEEDMQNLYFDSNFSSLVKSISKYNSSKNTYNFIKDFDDVFDDRILENDEYYNISFYVKRIYLFLLKSLINKVNNLDKNNLSIEDIKSITYLLDRNNWVGKIKVYDKYEINLLSSSDYDSYINSLDISLVETQHKKGLFVK